MDENAAMKAQLQELADLGIKFGWLTRRFPVLRGLKIAIGPYRKQFVVLGFLAAIAAILDTIMLYIVARLALLLTSGETSVSLHLGPFGHHTLGFAQMLIASAVVLVAVVAVNWPLAKLASLISERTLLRARQRLLDAYVHASWSFRSMQPEGHLQEMMMSYGHMNESVIMVTATVIVSVFGLIALAVASVIIAQWIAVIAAVGLALLALLLRPMTMLIRKHSHTYALLNREYASAIAQTAAADARNLDVRRWR